MNRLSAASSPYLLQHKDNPVDWLEWGEEAFEQARGLDRPIFLSIGYATCHWCHVMAHESFEDEEVAALMNRAFVNVKLDREERPDVDGLYMQVCQMLNGHGGWPLTIIMLPDGRPFFAGTYLPKENRHGRLGMLGLIPEIERLWTQERARVIESAESIAEAVRANSWRDTSDDRDPHRGLLVSAVDLFTQRFDRERGGFGGAPKFPSPQNLLLLLRYANRAGDGHATQMVTKTLDAMRAGGLFDHVGYGFHRYSTDADYLLPHFEKMLYDQAMLVWAYAETYWATDEPRFAVTVRETVEYVLRDLTSPEGAFYSAEDADSDGEEGTFYVWRVEELTDVLGEADGRFAAEAYGATLAGNFADEATGQRTGANVLHRIDAEPADEERLESVRRRLFEARGTRNRPLLDDKVLTDWNGLMIGSLAIASRHLSEPSYADAAVRAADFVWSHLRDSDGRLLHRYRAGTAGLQPTLDDYAFLAHGFIELYQTTFDHEHLARALQLTDEMTERFWDPEYDGFYLSPSDGEELLVRRKETYDGAIPSGASMALLNLVRLSRLTGRTDLDALADRHVRSIAGAIREVPNGHAMALVALDFLLGPSYEVTLAGSPAQIEPLLEAIRRPYVPAKVVLHRTAENADELAALAPYTRAQTEQSGRPTAYVCRNFACERPVTTPADLAEPFGGPTPFS